MTMLGNRKLALPAGVVLFHVDSKYLGINLDD